MTTSASDIKTAVEMLAPEDVVDGVPKLEAVQRVANDATITAADVAAALGLSAKAEKDKPSTDLILEVAAGADASTGPMHSVDPDADKEDSVDRPKDPNDIKRAKAAEARAELEAIQKTVDELEKAKGEVIDAIASHERRKGMLERVIEENEIQLTQAEVVKKIQAQTQTRLLAQAAARAKIADTMNAANVRVFASPLDQALAGGAKRTKMLGADGKVFEAPHPRSPEGVRAYGNWVHNGQKLPA